MCVRVIRKLLPFFKLPVPVHISLELKIVIQGKTDQSGPTFFCESKSSVSIVYELIDYI